MPNNVTPLPSPAFGFEGQAPRQPKRSPRLYPPQDVAEMTGVSYANALRLCRVHGVALGRRFYITLDQLGEALQSGMVTQ